MLMCLALNWINRVQVTPCVQSAQHWHIWNHSHCLVFLLTIGPRLCLLLSFFLSWVTKPQPNHYCNWADGEHLMRHLWSMKLLQHFAIMRLPRDTFARRRLTVTPVKRFQFHCTSPTSTIYLIFWYLFGCLRSTTHVASVMETNFDDTVIIYPTTVWLNQACLWQTSSVSEPKRQFWQKSLNLYRPNLIFWMWWTRP